MKIKGPVYSVIVSAIGIVYKGTDRDKADKVFDIHARVIKPIGGIQVAMFTGSSLTRSV